MAQIPKPFSRPSISLDSVPKTWQHVCAEELSVGDVVVDRGLITDIKSQVSPFGKTEYVYIFKSGDFETLAPGFVVYAFTENLNG